VYAEAADTSELADLEESLRATVKHPRITRLDQRRERARIGLIATLENTLAARRALVERS
jgi:hypothetical protein